MVVAAYQLHAAPALCRYSSLQAAFIFALLYYAPRHAAPTVFAPAGSPLFRLIRAEFQISLHFIAFATVLIHFFRLQRRYASRCFPPFRPPYCCPFGAPASFTPRYAMPPVFPPARFSAHSMLKRQRLCP